MALSISELNKLHEIVTTLVGEKPLIRINDLWVEVNEKTFGYKRVDVLNTLKRLGYKKKHIAFTKSDGTKETLIGYVNGVFKTTDKPIVDGYETVEGLNEKHAKEFLWDLYETLVGDPLEIEHKQNAFFGIEKNDDKFTLRFTRKDLHHLVRTLWYEKGICVEQGILFIVRAVEKISTMNYVRKNDYFKNKNGENRSRIQDKLFFTYEIV